MIFYDGSSDIDWFYDGKMTFEEMKNSSKYHEVTEVPVVLRDNGSGRVYGYERADRYALENGEVLDPQDPESTIQKIFNKQTGAYVDPMDIVGKILMRVTDLTEDESRSMYSFYPEWKAGISYKKDWIIRYNGDLYKVAQDHTSQAQWIPGSAGTESLYTSITVSDDGTMIWKQPTGAHDCYNAGDIVIYKNEKYKSLIDGNVWSPDTYFQGWEKISESSEVPSEPDDPENPSTDMYPDFVHPTGAHDAYNTGDIVKYNGKLYQSTMDGNIYSPDEYPQGWTEYTES